MSTIKPSIPLALILIVCAAAQVMAQAQVETIPDVVYGHKDGLAMTLDVIKPKANANGAAVIIMVSGGWVSNYSPPQQAATRFKDLLDKGFTLIAVRHGSSPKYLIPEIVSDVRRSVRFIRHNAKQWGVDPNRLGVFGGSADGDKDNLVPVKNSKVIHEAFQKNNVKTQLIIIEGAEHGFRGEDAKRAGAAMVAWFEQTLLKDKDGLKAKR